MAIFTRRLNPAASVVLFEGAKKPGAKILVSGGTRCNVTNASVEASDFWGGRRTIVRRILRGFPIADTIAFFEDIGVPLREEADGKLFPVSNRSRDVLAALIGEMTRVGAELCPDHRVGDVRQEADAFRISTTHGDWHARTVVLATGGCSLPKTGSDGGGLVIAERLGHTMVETTPALAPLVLSNETTLHQELSGVSQEVELTVWVDGSAVTRLRGALLWTHFGVSGPVALNASRHWLRARAEDKPVAITMNFCHGRSFDEIDRDLTTLGRARPKTSVQSALSTMFPASVGAALLRHLRIAADSPLSQAPRETRRRLVHALVEWTLPIVGARGYNYAEATAGGVALTDIDPASMESRVCPRLYLVGEMLDVDGRIGGFNFQWAWATAHVAARHLARQF